MNIVVITGASSGLGLEFALQLDNHFSESNCVDEIWLLARSKEKLNEVARVMETTTRIISLDVSNMDNMNEFSDLLRKENPVIRMLVNCAGFGLVGDFDSINGPEQLGMIDTNCKGLTHMTSLCIPYMKRNSRIIQIASSAGFMPQPGFAVYAASKAYALSFSRALSEELKDKKIYVTCVCPGPVDTPFFKVAEKHHKTFSAKKRFMADPEKVVKQAIFDSYHRREISIYGSYIRVFYLLAKCIPHKIILLCMRILKGTEKV